MPKRQMDISLKPAPPFHYLIYLQCVPISLHSASAPVVITDQEHQGRPAKKKSRRRRRAHPPVLPSTEAGLQSSVAAVTMMIDAEPLGVMELWDSPQEPADIGTEVMYPPEDMLVGTLGVIQLT